MIEQGANRNAIRLRIDEMLPHICGYMVPEKLAYVRDRGFKKGERKSFSDSMRGVALTVGSALSMHPVIRIHGGEENPATVNRSYEKSVRRMLEHVAKQIRAGKLMSGHVCLSYAGDAARASHQLAGLGAACLLGAAFTGLRGGLFWLAGVRVVSRLRVRMFSAMLRQDLGWFDETSTGSLNSRLSSDATRVADVVSFNLNILARQSIQALGGVAYLCYLDGRLAATQR